MPRFVDVVSGALALYESRAAVVWDATALYVGFWIEEPYEPTMALAAA